MDVARVSVSSGTLAQASGESEEATLSGNGALVAFTSLAPLDNTVADGNGDRDVYVHFREAAHGSAAGETRLISANAAGTAAGNGQSYNPAFSPGGNLLAFVSEATDLLSPAPAPGISQIYLRDLRPEAFVPLRLVSRPTGVPDGDAAVADGPCNDPSVSADGRYVVFRSSAQNLASPPPPGGFSQIYLRDIETLETRLVSVDDAGNPGVDESLAPGNSIALDGQGHILVVFESLASNLVGGLDNADVSDVFLRDTTDNTTELISRGPSGEVSNGFSNLPSISPNGRYIAFQTEADNLAPGASNPGSDVVLRDRQTGVVFLVSAGSDNVSFLSRSFAVSDAGLVVFESPSDVLDPLGDTNNDRDLFVFDPANGTRTRISLGRTGAEPDTECVEGAISRDGRVVVFDSPAANLVPGDTNALRDVFATALP